MTCRLFSHRGFTNNKKLKENTIEAFDNSLTHGFDAIELDLWYLEENFILNHDKPQKDLKKYDKFEDLLQKFHNKFQYWLDFKNLTPDNITQAIAKLKSIIDSSKIDYKNFIFVPCLDNIDLKNSLFAFNEIKKQFGNETEIGSFLSKISKNKWENYYLSLKENNIKNISINFKNLDEEFMIKFNDIKIFAWTINEEEDLNKMQLLKVQNIATDKIIPQNEKQKH